MKASIGFQLGVTAMTVFHPLFDCCYPILWQLSYAPENPNDDTVMEQHVAEA